jgi:threonine efflux protein
MVAVLLTLWVLHMPVVISPGAAVLLTTHLAAQAGRRAAAFGALGIALGACLWALAAVAGIGGLLHRWPFLQVGLQVAGAGYLLFVAEQMWRAGPAARGPQAVDGHRAFRAGLFTNLSNPKAALFFASIFSTVMPLHPSVGLVAAAVAMVAMNSLAWHLTLGYAVSRHALRGEDVGRRLRWSRAAAVLLAALGGVLLVAAVRVALSAYA